MCVHTWDMWNREELLLSLTIALLTVICQLERRGQQSSDVRHHRVVVAMPSLLGAIVSCGSMRYGTRPYLTRVYDSGSQLLVEVRLEMGGSLQCCCAALTVHYGMTQAYSPGLPFSYQPQPLFVSAQALELVAIDAIGHDEAQRMLRHAKRQAKAGRQQGHTQWYSDRTNTTTSCCCAHMQMGRC